MVPTSPPVPSAVFRSPLLTVLAAFALATSPAPAPACTCFAPAPPLESLQAADAVFSGTVTAIEVTDAVHVTIDADTFWKGDPSSPIEVITSYNAATCGMHFELDTRYIVYAYFAASGTLGTSMCSRTRIYDADEAAALGDPIWPGDHPRNFRRGETNDDGAIDLADAIEVIEWLFTGGVTLHCQKAADVDASGDVDVTDPIYLLDFSFLGGPVPPPPFAACGDDPTSGLPCDALATCP